MNLAESLASWLACHRRGTWYGRKENLRTLENMLPYGAGFDVGTRLAEDRSSTDKLVFLTRYHHMNDNGYYTHWSDIRVIAKPTFGSEVSLRIVGGPRGDFQEFVHDVFQEALSQVP